MNSKHPVKCFPSLYHIKFLYYVLVIFITSDVLSAAYGGNETDYEALLKIKSMITYRDPYGPLTSWNSSFHFCDWSGVTCGKRHRRVTSLQLRSLGLKGTLSPHIGNLSFLRGISLFNNSFQGAIPHELSRLSRLRFLYLHQNEFNNTIPSNLSRCYNLRQLWLGNNKLVGSIPNEISSLSKLTYLILQANNLTGGIPPSLGNITSMEVVSYAENPLGGIIPETLGHWTNLRVFYIGGCNLYGTIPHSLYNLSLLTNISLAENQLTGSLPSNIGVMLPQLVYLQLRANQLTGLLPSSISNCSRLRSISLSENKFNGKLTINFSNLRDIISVSLGANLFGSKEGDEMKFIDSLQNCTRLEFLSLGDCKFQGLLPTSIGNLSDQLHTLELGRNQLYGNLPLTLGNLVGLAYLHLGSNQFTGNIPSTIGKLQKLQLVGMGENKLSGPIPDSVGNLSMLNTLSMFSNMLEGHIPSSLGNCHQLYILDLYDNKLNGNIPTQLLQLSSLSISLNLSQNNLSGSLPTEVGDLNKLNYLDLSDNNLSGDIPSSLGGCISLSRLSLKGNLFQGMIPPSLSSLRGLEELDLSQNNLSGQIPRFLEQFTLQLLNLSFNDFYGEVPMVGLFANASAFSVFENRRLCGGIVGLRLPKCKETTKHKKRFPLFVVFILVTSALIIIICLVSAWCYKKTSTQMSQSSTIERYLQVSYGQLFKATNGFSEANLIGIGGFSSVYKGVLDPGDNLVAIKVLNLQNRGAERSFIRECEVWRSIRHRNLLKIITSCSSVDFHGNDFKALVYEFMPNGSLNDWLHSNASQSRLNLLQRINILLDVAFALDYIHNDCQPPLVHGDLKPSNILLNDDMTAHVGDFGLARFCGTTSNQNSSTGVRGTIGYVAPEYGLGSEMTSSGDVYSFGILTLEVITGKRPTDDVFNDDLNLHKLSYMALSNRVTDILNDDILNFYQEDKFSMRNKDANTKNVNQEDEITMLNKEENAKNVYQPDDIALKNKEANAKKIEECLASTINIGVSCSVNSPQERMNIKRVIHELKHILEALQNT